MRALPRYCVVALSAHRGRAQVAHRSIISSAIRMRPPTGTGRRVRRRHERRSHAAADPARAGDADGDGPAGHQDAFTDARGRFTVPDAARGPLLARRDQGRLRADVVRREALRSARHAGQSRRRPADDRPRHAAPARRRHRGHRHGRERACRPRAPQVRLLQYRDAARRAHAGARDRRRASSAKRPTTAASTASTACRRASTSSSATPRNSNAGEIRASTDAEIRAALAALQQPRDAAPARRASRCRRRGSRSRSASRPSTFPGRRRVDERGHRHARARAKSAAAWISRLQLVRTAKIEGTVVVPAGSRRRACS